MAIRTGWQCRVRKFLRTQLAVRACGLLLDYIIVARSAVDRIQPTFVSTRIGAYMTLEALCHAMYGGFKLGKIGFVAIQTRIRLFVIFSY